MKTAIPHDVVASPRLRAFSRPLDVASVSAKGLAVIVEPAPSDYPAIAAECGVPAVASLRVSYKVMPRAGGRFVVAGDLTARVTQTCVVSLESFESDLTGDIALTFAPTVETMDGWFDSDRRRRARRDDAPRATRRVVEAPLPPLSDDQPDLPDPIVDGKIDLGAIALEFLVLALDPYPKKPGVAFDSVVVGDDTPEATAFVGLAQLKDRT